MNKILISTLIACGLLLLDTPEAAAHNDGHDHKRYSDRSYSRSYDRDYYSRNGYRRDKYYASRYARPGKMPRWLKHDHSFKRWYGHSRLRYDRYTSWQRVFDIYRWERSRNPYRHH
jgi:hypothetical protein